MLQTLTEAEGREIEKEMDSFLVSLDFNTKGKIVELVKGLWKQGACEHDFKTFGDKKPICVKCFKNPPKNEGL